MAANEKINVDHLETAVVEAVKGEDFIADAREATSSEHTMSLREGIKLYPKAIAWSILLSTAIVMEGYDTCLLGSLYAFPAFQRKYGLPVPGKPGTYQLSAAWQAGLSNGTAVGEIIGLFFAGIISERIGYRKTLIGALISVTGFIFILFFAPNVQTLLAGEILCGIPWGFFQTLTTTYASEVTPVVLRHYLTTYVNLCWVFGQLIASGVLRSLADKPDTYEWAYRIPFAIQWIWPLPIIVGIYFAPESPWWLVRKGRHQEAAKALLRLTTKDTDPNFDAEKTVAMMIHTNQIEKELTHGRTYLDLFKGVNLRRTEIACAVWAIQNLCGSTFMGYSTYFYEQAGLNINDSFDMSIVQYCLGIIGTVSSWFFMRYFGRRTLYLLGLAILTLLLFIIGFLSLGDKNSSAISWTIGSFLLVFTFVYDFSVGPACYCLVPEMAAVNLRTLSTGMARNVYNIVGIINSVLTPYMLNPTAWNWGAKTGFFWGGICFLCLVWTFFRLPEPRGRTYAELDVLFEKKISARKFSKTEIDPFELHHNVEVYETVF